MKHGTVFFFLTYTRKPNIYKGSVSFVSIRPFVKNVRRLERFSRVRNARVVTDDSVLVARHVVFICPTGGGTFRSAREVPGLFFSYFSPPFRCF